MKSSHTLERLIRMRIEESASLKLALIQDMETIRLIAEVATDLGKALCAGRKIFVFGNGGSAADAQHIAAELVGRFKRERAGLPAIALSTNASCLTAVANDYSFEQIFSRQLEALGASGDFALGISTSGNSPNVIRAIESARARGMITVGLTGKSGGRLKSAAQRCICVPSDDTPRIQETHILLGHILCEIVEDEFCQYSGVGVEPGESR